MNNVLKMDDFVSYLPNTDDDYCNAAFYVREDSWPTKSGRKTVIKSHAAIKLPEELAGKYKGKKWKLNAYFNTDDGRPAFIIQATNRSGCGLNKGGPRPNEKTPGHLIQWSWSTVDLDEQFSFGKTACSAVEIGGGLFCVIASTGLKKPRSVRKRNRKVSKKPMVISDAFREAILKAALAFFGDK